MLVKELEEGLAVRMTYSGSKNEALGAQSRRSRERPPGILWPGILVISGQSRMMHQCLTPKAGGTNLC